MAEPVDLSDEQAELCLDVMAKSTALLAGPVRVLISGAFQYAAIKCLTVEETRELVLETVAAFLTKVVTRLEGELEQAEAAPQPAMSEQP